MIDHISETEKDMRTVTINGVEIRDQDKTAAVKSTEVFHRHAGQDWPSAEDCEVCFLQRQIRDQDKRVCDQADKIRNLEEQLAHYKGMYRMLREGGQGCSPAMVSGIRADFNMDPQHGPIIQVRVDGRWVTVYLMLENGVVTERCGSQYGIEVKGPWWKFRQMMETPELGAERDRLREVGKWLAAEARENWDKGRLSVDLMTAVEAWDRATLEGE